MIDLHTSDQTLIVAVTVSLGFLLLLFSLLVPEEIAVTPARLPDLPPLPYQIDKDETPERVEKQQKPEEQFTPPPSTVPRFAQAVNEALTREQLMAEYGPEPSAAATPMPDRVMAPPPERSASITPEPARYEWPSPTVNEPLPAPPPRAARLEPPARPERPEPPVIQPPQERGRRITWTSLVDESAEELDLPTRLKIIEALGLVGGTWSREILARAYEQEMDATVRGAIFLALRDSKSVA